MFKFFTASLIVTISLTACNKVNTDKDQVTASSPPDVSLLQLARSLKTQASCEAKNGIWKKVGLIQSFSCILPTNDAGKACTDKKQCQVACVVKDKGVAPGTQVTGQCHDSTYQHGCRAYVSNGKAGATLCAD